MQTDSTELLLPLAAPRPFSTLSTLPENPLSETQYRYSFVPHSRDHGSNLSGAGENYGEKGSANCGNNGPLNLDSRG